MARPSRIEYPGAAYHITSRDNDKKAVFKDDQDRERPFSVKLILLTALPIIPEGLKIFPRDPQNPALRQPGPTLEKIFSQSILNDKSKRDGKIAEAVEKYGYTRRSITDHLGVHSTYVSRILCGHYKR